MISHPTNSPPKYNATFDKQGGDHKKIFAELYTYYKINNNKE
jgi:hypothetical protein